MLFPLCSFLFGITISSGLDAQGSLTASLGYQQPDQLDMTLATVMGKVLADIPISPQEGILHHAEGIDLMPANIELSGMEVSLVNAMSREIVLREYIDVIKQNYDYVLVDCMPSLGMMTVNALAAADSVLIPVQAQYLPVKGLEQLLQSIAKVRRQINPHLKIDGILLTMVDARTNFSKDIVSLLHETYGGKLKIFDNAKRYDSREDVLSCVMNGVVPNVAMKYDKEERLFTIDYEENSISEE